MFKTSKWAMGRTLVHPIYCKGTLFYVSMTLLGSDGIYLGYTGLLPLRGDELWKTEPHWLKNLWMHPRHKILRTKMKPPETLQVGALTRSPPFTFRCLTPCFVRPFARVNLLHISFKPQEEHGQLHTGRGSRQFLQLIWLHLREGVQ